ncbi:MAG: hypothetical protein N2257_08490 [Thermodesulfovibrionales bacterium]|nr:hypothetical protein [Thermodesulfovibrionales bacterium]
MKDKRDMNALKDDQRSLNSRLDQLYDRLDRLSLEHKEDYKSLKDGSIHSLDQIIHILTELRR